ncbi:hypothetical protein CXK91_02455 [Stutzerimonas stutzeri]|uniref:Uncharacterized protein n=1 Tax=Stutzerimonas stutzeri TaxID=316 RepID=A0A2S4ATV4_STUST|nr:hypothetical protein [Stutzerimonas stutzeri]MCQ4261542.1 hypothetical protein [Stutzerimonas stutzeri]POH84840.1 hypothetical protein CXK91_02455 [Stutzerimonas stutzeri]
MKDTPAIPDSYVAWRHCITVECGIPLTTEFVQRRLAVLTNPKEYETQRFAEVYGPGHLQAVLAWYQRAALDAQARNALT